ncbi:MAG: Lrp/AsnC family transcriptional regulator [Alphaproteobacteria bacterium]|nr:Lrp/AsnC family transcriptional regulator [Alphaproteobacteria bacterium]
MKRGLRIDEVDQQLLRALQRDASLSVATLAEQVGASAASCWRRIRALEESGILRKAVRLVNPQLIGRGVNVVCQVRVKSHSLEVRNSFEQFVASQDEIMECYSMSGEWDYLLRVVTGDVVSYDRFLMRSLLGHPAVATAASHFALNQVKYTTALPL